MQKKALGNDAVLHDIGFHYDWLRWLLSGLHAIKKHTQDGNEFLQVDYTTQLFSVNKIKGFIEDAKRPGFLAFLFETHGQKHVHHSYIWMNSTPQF